jgi:hypothetical protein
MAARRCIDELAADAQSVRRFADAAFQHVADTEFPANLLDVDRLAPVREA